MMCLAVSVSACDCDSATSREGQKGFLSFSYRAELDKQDFDRPIAKGARLTVRVTGVDDQRVRQLHNVTSTTSAIGVTRSTSAPNIFMLRGEKEGKATIKVKATADRLGTVNDQINFSVSPVEYLVMKHQCTNNREAAYIQGMPIHLNSTRFSRDNRILVGEQGCSVGFDRPDIQRIDCTESKLTVEPINAPGPINVRAIEQNGRRIRNALVTHIVTPELVRLDISTYTLTTDQDRTITLLAKTNNWPVCSELAFDVDILTSSTCSLGAQGTYGQFGQGNNNRFTVRGESSGTCDIRVSLPTARGADSWEFSLEVNDAEDDDDDDDDF